MRCHGFPHNADHGLSERQSIKASGNAGLVVVSSEDIGNCAHDDDETEEEMEQSAAASAGPSTLRRKYTDAHMDATVLESESASEAEPPTTKPKK